MTVYQEAHSKIDQFPEETVSLIIQLMDKMKTDTSGNKAKHGTKSAFLATAGKINIDQEAVYNLREESLI